MRFGSRNETFFGSTWRGLGRIMASWRRGRSPNLTLVGNGRISLGEWWNLPNPTLLEFVHTEEILTERRDDLERSHPGIRERMTNRARCVVSKLDSR